MPYDGEQLDKSLEEWKERGGVTTFPVLRHTRNDPQTGCGDPEHGPRFYSE